MTASLPTQPTCITLFHHQEVRFVTPVFLQAIGNSNPALQGLTASIYDIGCMVRIVVASDQILISWLGSLRLLVVPGAVSDPLISRILKLLFHQPCKFLSGLTEGQVHMLSRTKMQPGRPTYSVDTIEVSSSTPIPAIILPIIDSVIESNEAFSRASSIMQLIAIHSN